MNYQKYKLKVYETLCYCIGKCNNLTTGVLTNLTHFNESGSKNQYLFQHDIDIILYSPFLRWFKHIVVYKKKYSETQLYSAPHYFIFTNLEKQRKM